MAVLKRGDNVEAPTLDSPRRFAQSFSLAWNAMCAKSGELLKLFLLPSCLTGVLGCIWLGLYENDVFWSDDALRYVLYCFMGACLLYVWSVMRVAQFCLFESPDELRLMSLKDIAKAYTSYSRSALRSFVPLFVAYVLTCVALYLTQMFSLPWAISLGVVLALAIVLFVAFGMVQTCLETTDTNMKCSFKMGLKLNGRYFGGMCVLFVISFLLMAIVGLLLAFGEGVLIFLNSNYSHALFLDETFVAPWYVGLLGYLFAFCCVTLLSLVQVVWSLPQQVHFKSILYKYNRYKQTAKA